MSPSFLRIKTNVEEDKEFLANSDSDVFRFHYPGCCRI